MYEGGVRKDMRYILSLLVGVFVLMFIGSILLSEFPQLQPILDEGVAWVKSMYELSLVKYGTVATGILIIGLLILFGDKKR